MKTVLLNTYDTNGGAALATYRLHRGLLDIGVDSKLLVQQKSGSDSTVIGPSKTVPKVLSAIRPYIERLPLRSYPGRSKQIFSPAAFPGISAESVLAQDPDVVHLFWVTAGFVRPEMLAKLHKPLVWTLHDMWPFTGGCHYDSECGKYQDDCGSCPVLGSDNTQDLSHKLLSRKRQAWQDIDLTVVATSHWIGECAKASSLFHGRRIEVIPNGFDTEKYKQLDKLAARAAFNLPAHKSLVLFSSFGAVSDPRKGFQHLIPAIQNIPAANKGQIELVILGAGRPERPIEFEMPVHYIEHLQDEISQVLLYSAVDVLVLPSQQENLSNTVIEAMLCGTPVVAFDIGGMPDMIDHAKNGYLARPFDSQDLAEGIMSMLTDHAAHVELSKAARKTALERFQAPDIAARYRDLYLDVLK